ncbi:hypothetical protein PIB30_007005 [Stylosanthes scabra]|uniref:Core-2/I-branching beta-1,6-N-acetylglucosaminyltransferase family protein n=1 Tax=Stylosanthes scabra TaxID=79078 RepID=A0ABU6Z163_9FABA|nr:hypothetical protein [Stylosanthes scabra]
MLSSNPLTCLLCALFLCLPIAIIIFTSTTIKNNDNHVIFNPPVTNTFNLSEVYKDDENDEMEKVLFRIASRTNQNPSYNNNKPKKLAFMFLIKSSLPFAPLWESFFKNAPKTHFSIYLHVDPTNFTWIPPYSSVFHYRTVYSKRSARNSAAVPAATRRLLASALVDDPNNYMFILLSDSCIPLHSFNFTYNVLANSNKSFVEMKPQDLGAFFRYTARGPHAMLPEVRYEDFRYGSHWFSLTRQHARMVVADTRVWSKFKLPCLYLYVGICYPEEIYFPTLMNMLDSKGCVYASLTNVDWSLGAFDGHPRMYKKDEVGPKLIWALRRDRPKYDEDVDGERHDPFLFARKFSPDALHALMAIADSVIFKD